MIKKIAVLTSGGDAPGMNAAIRGVVRAALAEGLEVFGIYDGYQGLYNNKIKQLNRYSVSDIINRGGTFLGSARFPEFKDPAVREKCAEILRSHGIDALVVIGGDGSYMGAKLLMEEHGFPCVGIPGTIDTDHCSDLTISAGIAGGCEYIVASEMEFNREELIRQIERSIIRGKRHAIIAITELITDVHSLAREIEARVGHETRATVLGHIQRGGSPCAFDRILASRMGVYAVDILLQGKGGYCVGIQNEKLVHHDIIDAINNMRREFKADWLEMAKRLE